MIDLFYTLLLLCLLLTGGLGQIHGPFSFQILYLLKYEADFKENTILDANFSYVYFAVFALSKLMNVREDEGQLSSIAR